MNENHEKGDVDIKKLALLEAILFTADEPLSLKELEKLLKTDEEEILYLIDVLKEKLEDEMHGIVLSDVGGYRLTVKPHFQEKVSRLTPHADMSRGLLRVLSIIMYHEPIKQSDIVKVVGNRTYEYVRELIRRGFVKSEKHSRTRILSLTPAFEEYFGVSKAKLKEQIKKMGGKDGKKYREELEKNDSP